MTIPEKNDPRLSQKKERKEKKWHSVRQEKKMKVGQGELMKSNKGSQN